MISPKFNLLSSIFLIKWTNVEKRQCNFERLLFHFTNDIVKFQLKKWNTLKLVRYDIHICKGTLQTLSISRYGLKAQLEHVQRCNQYLGSVIVKNFNATLGWCRVLWIEWVLHVFTLSYILLDYYWYDIWLHAI